MLEITDIAPACTECNNASAQVEALLDKIGQQPPVMDYVACQLERLGYAWSYRVVESAGERARPAHYSASRTIVGSVLMRRLFACNKSRAHLATLHVRHPAALFFSVLIVM